MPRTEWIRYITTGVDSTVSPTDVCVASDGSVYIAADHNASSAGNRNLLLLKYSPTGEFLWQREYDSPTGSSDYADELHVDAAGDLYLTGSYGFDGTTCATVVKYTSDGDTIWSRQFSETCSLAVWVRDWDVDAAGNIYFCGFTRADADPEDWVVAKYLPNGSFAWMRTYAGVPDDSEEALALAVDDVGNVCVTGTAHEGGSAKALTIKYDVNGTELWQRTYARLPGSLDIGHAIAVDGMGNLIVAGQTLAASGPDDIDWLLIKYTPDGDTLWTRHFGVVVGVTPNLTDLAALVKVDNSDNIVVGGSVSLDDVYGGDFAVVQFSAGGQLLWQNVYDGIEHDVLNDMEIAADGSIVVIGCVDRSDIYNTGDMIIRRYSSNGQVLWTSFFYGPGNTLEVVPGLAQDTSGSWVVSGWSSVSYNDHVAFTNKYSHYVCGDADSNGLANIADVVYLIQYAFSSDPEPVPLASGDANCNGLVNIADVVYLIQYIFGGGPAPCAGC